MVLVKRNANKRANDVKNNDVCDFNFSHCMERNVNEWTDEKMMILPQNALSEWRYRRFPLRSDYSTCCQNKQNGGQRSSSLESK